MSEQPHDEAAPIDPFPWLHVRPALGWVNDPNGIGRWDGRWHVMYQWNPHAPRHADIHWGHMSSSDLLTWHDEGVALRPRPGSIDAAGVWSGVAVPDGDDVVLVYTAVPDFGWNAGVAVARRDATGSWRQPDRTASRHPARAEWVEVRDPFVVEISGRRLGIMGAGRPTSDAQPVDGHPPRPGRGAVLVYDAADLDRWTLLGPLLVADELGDGMVGPGAIWECPQLLPLGDRWVLVVSWDEGPGALRVGPDGTPAPRLGVAAYVGDLDLGGPVPRFVATSEVALDHGPDFYAPQVVADGGRLLAWAWAWEGRGTGTNHRADDDVARSGWAGTLTFPRELVLDPSGVVRCIPARELDALVGEPLDAERTDGGWELHTGSPAWTFTTTGDVEIDLVDESAGTARQVWHGADDGATRTFIDGSIVEVFTHAGSTTLRAYPTGGESWRVRSTGPVAATTLRIPTA